MPATALAGEHEGAEVTVGIDVDIASIDVIRAKHRIISESELDAVLPGTDLLILSLPDTPETRGILNGKRLDLLPRVLDALAPVDGELLIGKYILNLSDEALAQALGVRARSVQMKLTRARHRARILMERMESTDADGR